MFSFFKKKFFGKVDLSGLGSDMHSHLLPGIDDGASDVDDSLQLISGLTDLGYQKLITTPHIMWDMYKNDEGTISSANQQLQQAMSNSSLKIPVKTAAEYYLDEHFDILLQNHAKLLTISENRVLVEFSFISTPMNLKAKLFELQIQGYQPILAHPERYMYFASEKIWYDELKTMGCLFQVNILSLSGYYGKLPFDLANYLIKREYVDLLGTDLHHIRHLEALRSSPQIMNPIKFLLDSGRLLNPTL